MSVIELFESLTNMHKQGVSQAALYSMPLVMFDVLTHAPAVHEALTTAKRVANASHDDLSNMHHEMQRLRELLD